MYIYIYIYTLKEVIFAGRNIAIFATVDKYLGENERIKAEGEGKYFITAKMKSVKVQKGNFTKYKNS